MGFGATRTTEVYHSLGNLGRGRRWMRLQVKLIHRSVVSRVTNIEGTRKLRACGDDGLPFTVQSRLRQTRTPITVKFLEAIKLLHDSKRIGDGTNGCCVGLCEGKGQCRRCGLNRTSTGLSPRGSVLFRHISTSVIHATSARTLPAVSIR